MPIERTISRCRFKETVYLSHLTGGPSLVFVDCVFEKGLCARDGEIGASLSLIGCDLHPMAEPGGREIAIDLENARISNDLTLFNCRIGGRFFAPSIRVQSDLRLRGCRVAPSLDCIGQPVRMDELSIGAGDVTADRLGTILRKHQWDARVFDTGPAVSLDGADVGGDLEITAATPSEIRSARTGDSFLAAGWANAGASAASVVMGGIDARNVSVGGNVALFGLLCRGGGLDFTTSRINGDLTLYSWEASGMAGPQFRTIGGKFPASVAERETEGNLVLKGVRIDGDLDLQMAEIDGWVSLYGSEIAGSLHLLGCQITGDFIAYFAKIKGFMNASRDSISRARHRKALEIGGTFGLSGAEVRGVELRGIEVKRDITVRTGTFGRLFLTLGVEQVPENENEFRPEPCRAARIELSAITVDETLDVSGLQVGQPVEDDLRREERGLDNEAGFVLSHSAIGRDLRFFISDHRKYLEHVWGRPVPWKDGTLPAPETLQASVWGNLDLQASVIEGHLDLRNVKVQKDILMNDVNVRLDVRLGARHGADRIDEKGLTTECRNLAAEKLQCGGDVDLTGLRVRREGGLVSPGRDTSAEGGDLVARGARVTGEILFLPREQSARRATSGPQRDPLHKVSPVDSYAWIEGELDLTAAQASHLVISSLNLGGIARSKPEKARVSLERGQFGRLEIVKPPPDPINLSKISVDRWVFGEEIPTFDDYVDVLGHMHPFDRSVWIDVETALRNQARDEEANNVYREMRWKAREKAGRTGWQIRRQSLERFSKALLLFLTGLGAAIVVFLFGLTFVGNLTPVGVATTVIPLVLVVLLLIWILFDREGLYGTVLRFGTVAWWPMILALLLFPLTLFIFSQPGYVRASPELLEVMDQDHRAGLSTGRLGADLELTPDRIFDAAYWSWQDALALTLRYQVPIVPSITHTWWEAGGASLPMVHLSAERYALWLSIFHWIAWPLFLVWLAARVVRGQQR